MGAAAMKTSRIKLCAGVLIPSNRIAPVAANALATLNSLAPGRVVFGVSTGYTGRRTMGLGPVSLARLEKYVEVVEGLLKGKTVEWSEEGGTHKIRFLNPDLGLINIADPIQTFRLRSESASPYRQVGRGLDRLRQLSATRTGRH
jgi:alkanesulfonate monooxygenase SsuD/methylene tetrahydromethanopterin reductase-like flavin-dependent oxidoreductase (luciferase family)